MVNFIICDDNKVFANKIVEVISRIMMEKEIEYRIHTFNTYDKKFINIINKPLSLKIYILDIETPGMSGIDVARIIRNNDIESMLIFLTAYFAKYMKEILKGRFMFLDFIDKNGDYISDLEQCIEDALKNISKKNIIRFKSKNTLYTIETKDILYIARTKDRKCNIITIYNTIVVNKTLAELYNMLDERFDYCHRACIVNKERIREFNKKKRIIIFDNNNKTDIVSTRFSMDSE